MRADASARGLDEPRDTPIGVARRLVDRGSVFDVAAVQSIYADDQYLVMLEADGSFRRLSRTENLALFENFAASRVPPLSNEAEFIAVEEVRDSAVV